MDFEKKIGFDNEKYLQMQSEHIRERIAQFGDKLYLEFGGKLFDDFHASIRPAMPSLRHSPSGTFLLNIRSTWPMRRQQRTLMISI